jgi:hypothetical protein
LFHSRCSDEAKTFNKKIKIKKKTEARGKFLMKFFWFFKAYLHLKEKKETKRRNEINIKKKDFLRIF